MQQPGPPGSDHAGFQTEGRRAPRGPKTDMFHVDQLTTVTHSADRYACLTVLSGAQVGRCIDLGDSMLIGRSDDADLRLLDKGMSRVHARLFKSPMGPMCISDLNSSNGTWVNGRRISEELLQDGDTIQVGAALLRYGFVDAIERDFLCRQYESVTRDALTGCHNRKAFDERLPAELAFASRHHRSISLVMVDIDHFKAINDTFGHQGGDAVLRTLGEVLLSGTRSEDVVCRYGGEEFALILREQSEDGAWVAAERLRSAIERAVFTFKGKGIDVTASLGVATSHVGVPDPFRLVQAADKALYAAKIAGRNRVMAAPIQS